MARVFPFLLLALVMGCGGGDAPNPRDKPKAPATAVPPPGAKGLAQLAGEWTATGQVPGYGVAVAVVQLNSQGAGTYLVVLSGHQQSGAIQIVDFADGWIEARAAGSTHRIAASLQGQRLTLDLPMVGKTVATRK